MSEGMYDGPLGSESARIFRVPSYEFEMLSNTSVLRELRFSWKNLNSDNGRRSSVSPLSYPKTDTS